MSSSQQQVKCDQMRSKLQEGELVSSAGVLFVLKMITRIFVNKDAVWGNVAGMKKTWLIEFSLVTHWGTRRDDGVRTYLTCSKEESEEYTSVMVWFATVVWQEDSRRRSARQSMLSLAGWILKKMDAGAEKTWCRADNRLRKREDNVIR